MQEIKAFDLVAGPGGPSQEFEAGFEAGVALEAVDIHLAGEKVPAVGFHEDREKLFESDSLKGVFRIFRGHRLSVRNHSMASRAALGL